MKAFKCDRCAEFKTLSPSAEITVDDEDGVFAGSIPIQLCDMCWNDFKRWLRTAVRSVSEVSV